MMQDDTDYSDPFSLFDFEDRTEPLATRMKFAGRLAVNVVVALAIIGVSLAIGMIGYHATERMDWLDAFLNAAMILGGMGPVDTLHTAAGKAFAGGYALFSGLLIIIVAGVVLAPIFHRVLHAFHIADDDRG